MKDRTILHALRRGLEGGLVQVRVEALAVDGRVEALEAVLLERLHQDRLRHLEAVVQVDEIAIVVVVIRGTGRLVLILARHELLGRNGGQGPVQVVDRVDQILGEALDRKLSCRFHLPPRSLLQVPEVGDGA